LSPINAKLLGEPILVPTSLLPKLANPLGNSVAVVTAPPRPEPARLFMLLGHRAFSVT
jgi:hypothetical protein